MFRKTKVVCTIGPVTSSQSQLRRLIEAGMNMARFNFSHGTRETHGAAMKKVKQLSSDLQVPVGILQDLAGPKVRIGTFSEGRIELAAGAKFTLTTRLMEGSLERVSVSYDRLPQEVKPGDPLLLADGTIELEVKKISETDIECVVLYGGMLASRKGVNCPSGLLGLPILGAKDLEDLQYGVRNQVDYIGLSFVRTADDVKKAQQEIRKLGARIPIIAKIETQAALDHFEEILQEADGIMIARGDLSIETPYARVPILQKHLISRARSQAKPVITATQMLWSMVNLPRPTRAEVADVANAILDGSDAVMLSEETTLGKYPIRTVKTMASIALETESARYQQNLSRDPTLFPEPEPASTMEALARTACDLAARLRVDVIGTVTFSGRMVRHVSKFQPNQPILAVTPRPETYGRLTLVRGVIPLLLSDKAQDPEELVDAAFRLVRKHGWEGKQAIFVGSDRVRKGEI